MKPLTEIDLRLLDRWQRHFPLSSRPYAIVGDDVGLDERGVLAHIEHLLAMGLISRVGATLRPNTAGASLLAAMRVPADRFDAVVAVVNAEPGVNHNYEREHAYNLWFVVTGADRTATAAALTRIRAATGLDILELPLLRGYHIDLGFSLTGAESGARRIWTEAARPADRLDDCDLALLRLIEGGLPLVPAPYQAVAAKLGTSEPDVIARLSALAAGGIVTRFGLIVRHRALGIEANAMSVWNVPDDEVDAVGARLAAEPAVTLCYRRPRRLPDWPYNLFAMVHGRERAAVEAEVAALTRVGGLGGCDHAVLFSRRCFRQRGPSLRAA